VKVKLAVLVKWKISNNECVSGLVACIEVGNGSKYKETSEVRGRGMGWGGDSVKL